MEVSVIIVSMNNYEVLSRCLDSIRTHTSTSYEVFVVAYLFSPDERFHGATVKILLSQGSRRQKRSMKNDRIL